MSYSKDQLETLIEEAPIDCYGDYEYDQGILCSVEDGVEVPFKAMALGEPVEVKKMTQVGKQIKAVFNKAGKKYNGLHAPINRHEQDQNLLIFDS